MPLCVFLYRSSVLAWNLWFLGWLEWGHGLVTYHGESEGAGDTVPSC